jgi:hypothetical protein
MSIGKGKGDEGEEEEERAVKATVHFPVHLALPRTMRGFANGRV